MSYEATLYKPPWHCMSNELSSFKILFCPLGREMAIQIDFSSIFVKKLKMISHKITIL